MGAGFTNLKKSSSITPYHTYNDSSNRHNHCNYPIIRRNYPTSANLANSTDISIPTLSGLSLFQDAALLTAGGLQFAFGLLGTLGASIHINREKKGSIWQNDDRFNTHDERELLQFIESQASSSDFHSMLNDRATSLHLLKPMRSLEFYKSLISMGWNASWLNHPLNEGSKFHTLLLGFIRNGDSALIKEALKTLKMKDILFYGSYSQDYLKECLVDSTQENIDWNDSSLLIGQSGCTTLVQQGNKLLRLPGLNVHEIRNESFVGLFSIYLNPGHASIFIKTLNGSYIDLRGFNPSFGGGCVEKSS